MRIQNSQSGDESHALQYSREALLDIGVLVTCHRFEIFGREA